MAPKVFPMYVGVILRKEVNYGGRKRIPHVCGGDPKCGNVYDVTPKYSPCMWG